MKEAIAYYTKRTKKFEKELRSINKKLAVSSTIRLLIFLLGCGAVYFFFGQRNILLPVIIGCIAIFLFLVNRHTDLKAEKNRIKELIRINQLEIDILKTGDFSQLPEGSEFIPEEHEYCRDIDLFGRKSFFQYVNRTAIKEGSKRLAEILLSNEIREIPKKQEANRELSQKADWRQNFSARASLIDTDTSSASIIKWVENYQPYTPKIMKWLPYVFSGISVLLTGLYIFSLISGYALFLWFLLGIMIAGTYLKKTTLLSNNVSKAQETFRQYAELLKEIENEDFTSEKLQFIKQSIGRKEEKASVILKKFSSHIDRLDQRNNFLMGAVLNGFLLWDLMYAQKLESWITTYSEIIGKWFKAVEEFDAQNSLANFAFNHQDYHYPKIRKEASGIETKGLGHPLLDPSKRVDNDFSIDSKEFFIVTGANMAGKSTFLRTVSLQILMSNTGLPICAEKCDYGPIKLITSMRTSDSLGDDESYFFSELKRLKYIVDKIDHERYFIILDEILKGTNSTDKAIGSRKFVKRLVRSGATGIIATHDLSLCEIAAEENLVENYYFDAEIKNDELHFDYELKSGICQNMNASFLLKKMKIVAED